MMTPERRRALEVELELKRRRAQTEPTPAAPEAPPAEPTMWERAREGVKGAGRAVAGAARDVLDVQEDVGQSFLKGASLGLDDEIAALTARAGGLVQRQRDADDLAGMGGGESVLESWRATAPLGEEAKQERRAETARASQRSPISSGVGTLAGALTAGMAAPGAQGGRLAQVASGTATGAIGGAGMGDAEGEDAAVDALMGGAIGGGLTAGVQGAGALRNVLRARAAAPKVAAAAAPAAPAARTTAADLLEEAAGEGPMALLRKKGLQRLAGALRPKAAPAAPTRPEWMAGLTDDVGAAADNASGLELGRVLKPKSKPLPEFDVDVVDELDPIAVQADDIVEEVATASPPLQPDDVMVTPQRASVQPVPAPPAPARGPAGEVLTDLRRSTLGRRATQTEIRNAIEAVALRDGNASIEHLTNQIGAPTGEIQAVLAPMMRDFKFREAVKAGVRPAGGASSAVAEADEMGRTIRDAQQGARSPIDNVSGRKADQVFAVQQQERWRSAYDALPAEQRAAFVQQLRATSGLSDDAVRQRLKMTKAEWRRTSFERSKAAAPMDELRRPVLRPKATAP